MVAEGRSGDERQLVASRIYLRVEHRSRKSSGNQNLLRRYFECGATEAKWGRIAMLGGDLMSSRDVESGVLWVA